MSQNWVLSLFSLSFFSYVVLACTSSEDIQISYSTESNPEPSQTDSGEMTEPSSQPSTEPSEPAIEPSSPPEPSQEDTGTENENGQDWDMIPESLVSLNEGVHRVFWQEDSVYVSVPTTYSGDTVLPMVVMLHGGVDCSSNPAQELAFTLLGQFPAVVLYPQLSDCGWATNTASDVAFVQGVITDWSAHSQIDSSRVSLLGIDQGGQVALDVDIDDLFGLGVLLTSAKEGWTIPSSRSQHSFVQLVNKRDALVPFPGGNGLQSVPDSVLQWVEHNDCYYAPEISNLGAISMQEYPDCISDSRVVLASVLPDPWHEECQSSWQQAQQNGTQMIPPEGIDCGETHELPDSAFSQSSWKFVWDLLSQ